MNNLVAVEVKNELGSIQDNLDAVEASIRAQIEEYKGYVVTADSIPFDKKMLADIRKEQKVLDDSRKAIKKEWNKPYEEFEARAKRIIALYDEPIKVINDQLQVFEEDRKAAKRLKAQNIYECIDKNEFEDWITFESVFQEKWLNATYSEKDIARDIEKELETIAFHIDGIKALESEFEDEGIAVYKKTRDFTKAIQAMTNALKMKETILRKEQEKAQEPKVANFPNVPPMEDDAPFEVTRTVVVRVSEKEFDKFIGLMDFNGYRYEVM